MSRTEIEAAWARIEAWLTANATGRDPAKDLSGPAGPSDIAALEAGLGREIGEEHLASLLVHDGQEAGAYEVLGRWRPLSAAGALRLWRQRQALVAAGDLSDDDLSILTEGPVRPADWRSGWIPFAQSGNGDLVCVDLDPAPGGVPGQAVRVDESGVERVVLADSLSGWLERLADTLRDGFEIRDDGAVRRIRR